MISLPCPHCGSRDAAEFAYIGERVARPDPNDATPQEWRGYLYLRRNPAGWTDELWLHRAGCGRYLAIGRDTATGEVSQVRDTSKRTVSDTSAGAGRGTSAGAGRDSSAGAGRDSSAGDAHDVGDA